MSEYNHLQPESCLPCAQASGLRYCGKIAVALQCPYHRLFSGGDKNYQISTGYAADTRGRHCDANAHVGLKEGFVKRYARYYIAFLYLFYLCSSENRRIFAPEIYAEPVQTGGGWVSRHIEKAFIALCYRQQKASQPFLYRSLKQTNVRLRV